MSALAPLLQAFFTERLIAQRHASEHTIASYSDTFRLLLGYAGAKTGKKPSASDIADLDAALIAGFLDHLEHERHNSVRTRNNRLAAIHSLFSYAALHHPEHAADIQRVLAIPVKRYDRRMLTWLTDTEVDALLATPDRNTWTGQRRPRAARPGRPNRVTDLRTDYAHPRRRPPRRRRARALHGQGPQGTRYPAHRTHRRGAAQLARNAPGRPTRSVVRHPNGDPAQSRRP
jgi:integrase